MRKQSDVPASRMFGEPVRVKVGGDGIGRIRSTGEAIDWLDHLDSRQRGMFHAALAALRRADSSGVEEEVEAARAVLVGVLDGHYLLVK